MTPAEDHRKQLRAQLALLTGLMTMREELDRDIAELTGNVVEPHANTIDVHVNGVSKAPEPVQEARPEPRRTEQQTKQSLLMKKRWKIRKALGLGKEGPTPTVASAKPKRAGPSSSIIGFNTNAEVLYEYASAHGNVINTVEAKVDLAAVKHSLANGSRLSVALAEMKRKGFLLNDGKHRYRLTEHAVKIYTKERKSQ